jgi:nucleotide-binding universal stress UspA family protein
VTIIAWIVEGTWPACIDAVRAHAPEGADIVLLHVTGPDVPGAAHGAYAGLLGRARPERDPGTALEHLAAASAEHLLAGAALRLGRPCTRNERTGRVEREVVAAAEGADLLILARDGDRTHLGPRSLSPASRFIVDHAPCPVLLVWPEIAPASTPSRPHRTTGSSSTRRGVPPIAYAARSRSRRLSKSSRNFPYGFTVGPEQRVQRPAVLLGQLPRPLRIGQDPLQQQGIDVDEAALQQVEREPPAASHRSTRKPAPAPSDTIVGVSTSDRAGPKLAGQLGPELPGINNSGCPPRNRHRLSRDT